MLTYADLLHAIFEASDPLTSVQADMHMLPYAAVCCRMLQAGGSLT